MVNTATETRFNRSICHGYWCNVTEVQTRQWSILQCYAKVGLELTCMHHFRVFIANNSPFGWTVGTHFLSSCCIWLFVWTARRHKRVGHLVQAISTDNSFPNVTVTVCHVTQCVDSLKRDAPLFTRRRHNLPAMPDARFINAFWMFARIVKQIY